MVDSRELRNACGQFATGVMVVTGRIDDGSPVGVTVNSFSSVSLDPPLVLFCLDKQALSFDAFSMGKNFALNVLSEDQRALSDQFAQQGGDKYTGVSITESAHGIPLLNGCLATIECAMHAVHEGGDHQIIVGEVERVTTGDSTGRPLLFFRGKYNNLA